MRILILSQYYPPETGAPQNRLSDLAKRLSKKQHNITVLTAMPNYPKGEIFEKYQGRLMMEEQVDGIRVVRTWIYATKKKQFFLRLLNYFSFVFFSIFLGSWKVGPQDYIVVESPPLFLGISGFIISRSKGAKMVFNISDLWPESAVSMRILKNSVLIDLSRKLEEFLYRESHLITGQTQGIIENIKTRFPDKKIALITNGVDTEKFNSTSCAGENGKTRKEFGLEGKFVIGYAGLHGIAQGLETVIQSAQQLVEHQEIFFVFFGEGPKKEMLQEMMDMGNLSNVKFFSTQPTSRMPEILSLFDIAVIPLKKIDLFKGALPSKMFEAMAAAVPVLLSVHGEAHDLLETAQAGICVEPENSEAMTKAILDLYHNPDKAKRFGENGRKHVLEYYDRRKIGLKFEALLLESSHANDDDHRSE